MVVCFGLVCSTFVSVSRGSTRRHYFLPLGDEDALSVQKGNLLANRSAMLECESFYTLKQCPPGLSRTILAMYQIMSRGGVWIFEQPSSSLVFRMPKFQRLLQTARVPRHEFKGFPKTCIETLLYKPVYIALRSKAS